MPAQKILVCNDRPHETRLYSVVHYHLLTRTPRNHRATLHRRIQTVRKNSFTQGLPHCVPVVHFHNRSQAAILCPHGQVLSSSCLAHTPEIIMNRSVTPPSKNSEYEEELVLSFPGVHGPFLR